MSTNKLHKFYNKDYYYYNYVKPLYFRSGLGNIYFLYISYFCTILPIKLKRGDKVLDFGCGVGNWTWALRKFGIDVYGIDPSIDAKQFSREPRFCIYKDTKVLPFKDEYFEAVFSSDVLEHIEKKDLKTYIKELSRVCKKNMIHIIGVSDKGKGIIEDPTHLTKENEAWWKDELSKYDYKVSTGNKFYFFPQALSLIKQKKLISAFKTGY